MTTIAFFNNKGGVGKTSLVYHLAWMFAELGHRVVAADLDPQANLTSFFLDESRLEAIWSERDRNTIHGWISPLVRGVGDIRQIGLAEIERPSANIGLLVGDLALSSYEDELSIQWGRCLSGEERAFRVTTAFARIIGMACKEFEAGIALVDVGPNLGAINRAALVACDDVAIPLGPDLFSLQGLRNMGPALRRWRSDWEDRRSRFGFAESDLTLPSGDMMPAGYIMMRHSVRYDRPVKAYANWISQMPAEYRAAILAEPTNSAPNIEDDPHCLAQLKDYRSLMPMAQDSKKPMFLLRPADGAIGGHQTAVQACYNDFRQLALKIAERCGLW